MLLRSLSSFQETILSHRLSNYWWLPLSDKQGMWACVYHSQGTHHWPKCITEHLKISSINNIPYWKLHSYGAKCTNSLSTLIKREIVCIFFFFILLIYSYSCWECWLWVSQQDVPGTVSCTGTCGREFWVREREIFLRQLCDEDVIVFCRFLSVFWMVGLAGSGWSLLGFSLTPQSWLNGLYFAFIQSPNHPPGCSWFK